MACLAAPLVLWVPESLAACGGLWRAVATDWMPLIKSLETSMPDGWRPEASLPGCNVGWLAWLAGWLAWLASLAGWLQLAGCCWLVAAVWLTEIRKLAWKVVSHARRSRRSADLIRNSIIHLSWPYFPKGGPYIYIA